MISIITNIIIILGIITCIILQINNRKKMQELKNHLGDFENQINDFHSALTIGQNTVEEMKKLSNNIELKSKPNLYKDDKEQLIQDFFNISKGKIK